LIYNRWGEVIWESYDATISWDGTYKGQLCPTGSYVYDIKFGGNNNGIKYSFTGNVNLIR